MSACTEILPAGYRNERVTLSFAALLLTISLMHRCLEFADRLWWDWNFTQQVFTKRFGKGFI